MFIIILIDVEWIVPVFKSKISTRDEFLTLINSITVSHSSEFSVNKIDLLFESTFIHPDNNFSSLQKPKNTLLPHLQFASFFSLIIYEFCLFF